MTKENHIMTQNAEYQPITNPKRLTRRQRECFSVLVAYITENGGAPSLQWIGHALDNISKGNVHRLLSELEAHGLIRRQRYGRGKIEIVTHEDESNAA